MSRVLRCGPFSNGGNHYKDEPDPPNDDVVPVNAAKDNLSARWPWRHYEFTRFSYADAIVNETKEYKNGFPNPSMSGSYFYRSDVAAEALANPPPNYIEGDDLEGTSFGLEYQARFRCQANSQFPMTFKWNVAASTSTNDNSWDNGSSGSVEVYVNGVRPSSRVIREFYGQESHSSGDAADGTSAGGADTKTIWIPGDGTPIYVWVKIKASSYISRLYDEVDNVGTCFASIDFKIT